MFHMTFIVDNHNSSKGYPLKGKKKRGTRVWNMEIEKTVCQY